MSSFVHLHSHSHYSLLNALPTIRELVDAAKADGMDALALTDNGNLYGAVEFYQACRKEGVKPIIGIDAYLAPRGRHDREPGTDKPRARLVLLAKTTAGYNNLIRLVTDSHLEGFYYRPRIDRQLIEKYKDGLVCIVPSFAGETSHALKAGDIQKAHTHLAWYREQFGEDCYLEITHHPEIPGHGELGAQIKNLAAEMRVPLVAAHDVYYIAPEDRRARETMVKIQTGGTAENTSGFDEHEEDFSFISQAQAAEYFTDIPDALENSIKIAEQCNAEIEIGHWYFPDYMLASGKTPDEELADLTEKGISWRALDPEDPVIKERVSYELGIIKMKGYAKYFLVVGDLLREARERTILTTVRGSVAGSLVTYLLGITNVNPLEYQLPFERFLNAERPSAPDIDMDFADNRRDEMIVYVKEKYGADRVAQIGTFGKMLARAVVRDVARALGAPYATGDRIAKLIPFGSQGFPMTIDRALAQEPALRELYEKDDETRDIIDLAKKIEGRARHVGVHAAGVVIAPAPLADFVPLQYEPKAGAEGGNLITQYDMHSVGEDGVGLLKFDFLGIKNLSILADAVERVRQARGVAIDIEHIPLDDKKTFAMLARGETMGLFQLNGSGMTHFLRELRPSSIHDINAMVALYRPGPMEVIPEYIARKHNSRLVSYLDPRLEKILSRSYGVITYQDDVLMIARELAGYSWLEADMLRKAMGKKIPKVMAAEQEKLINGFIRHGELPRATAERLWKLIEPFAAYGFNKSHAASYGRVAYQTAYMKANFPVEYMAAVLTADSGETEKIAEIIHECERMGIAILPPDINESASGFAVTPSTENEKIIRFGLTTIKNFGEGIAEHIIAEREAHGPYASLADFLTRVEDRNLNKKSLEALSMSGALDRFAERGAMLASMDYLLDFTREQAAGRASAHDSLFAGLAADAPAELRLRDAPPASASQKLLWEKELLGVFVSGHPLDERRDAMKRYQRIGAVAADEREGIPITTSGLIEEVKEIMTKGGDRMAFARLADWEHSIEIVVFPSLLREHRDLLQIQSCIAVKGRLSRRNGSPSIVAEKVKSLV